MDKKVILRHFKNKNHFNAKEFDSACLEAQDYAKENGFKKEELELIVDYSLEQKLSSRRVAYLIKTLIPETYMSEIVIRKIVQYAWTKKVGKEATKAIFQWLIGLKEHKLTESNEIDRYYDFYMRRLNLDDPLAAKLVYLLTKPQDVKRWYVKKLLKINEQFKSKSTGAILYLFKTYRPDFVPENIPAYAAQSSFPKLPAYFEEAFSAAQERIHALSDAIIDNDNICWERLDSYKRRATNITLIPRSLVVDDNFNINESKYASLRKIRSLKQLHNYMLEHYSLDDMYLMQLLNNPAGRFILAYADNKIHTTVSYMIYSILCESFYNPRVQYEEMNYFLQCIASLQNELQQNIPILSIALPDYITSWDGDDHFEEITNLLEFITFPSFEQLYHNVLKHLRLLFISSNLYKKCDIINTIGNMIVNYILLHSPENTKLISLMTPDEQANVKFAEVIEPLVDFTTELCHLGLYLENNHCLLLNCILNLHEKVLSTESRDVKWIIPDSILYTTLFSYNPNNILQVYKICGRFDCISEKVKADYSLLNSRNSKLIDLNFFADMSRDEFDLTMEAIKQKRLVLNRHLAFSFHFILYSLNKTASYGFIEMVNLLNNASKEKGKEKKRKRIAN